MNLHESERALLEQLAEAKASWEAAVARAVDSSESDLAWSSRSEAWRRIAQIVRHAGAQKEMQAAVSELLSGVIHSVLVTLDGGSALAERTQLTITDGNGHEFIRFLHEFWSEYD